MYPLLRALAERRAALPPPFPPLGNTYGIMLIGACFGCMLFGLTLHQAYRYHYTRRTPLSKSDSVFVRYTVILVMQIWHTAISIHAVYYYLIRNYAKPPALILSVWSANLLPVTMSAIVLLCQSLFAFRIWYMNRKAWIVVVPAAGISIATTAEAFSAPGRDIAWWKSKTGLGVTLGADGILTGLLVNYLRWSRTFPRTASNGTRIKKGTRLDSVLVYITHTGILPCIGTLVSLIVDFRYPYTSIANGVNECTAKLYANTLLAVLNSPDFLRSHGDPYMPTQSSAEEGPSGTTLRFATIQSNMLVHDGGTDDPKPPSECGADTT
ncbi:hypothetical protein C2E23DRAFT_889629 [Lenzites betulinus]|nr:hypothetical protein C2E23DRAFT_889629 [Lenzites betulinus]